jgi:uncharacterized membrane protein SpoIIM required for sporulation
MRQNKNFIFCVLFAISLWLLPFLIRILFVETPVHINTIEEPKKTVVTKIVDAVGSNDHKAAFLLIFKNNIRGCVINIAGGMLLGLATLFNLVINGFATADVFVSSYQTGFSIENILKTTLPHSFELLGFWLSGAIGFSIAWKLIQFMKGRENSFTLSFIKQIGIGTAIVFLIMLCAAYVESYVSLNIHIVK